MPTLAQHRRALAQHRQRVADDLARYQASVRSRNDAIRAAKGDGMPAAEAYELAGISQSAYSRTSRGLSGGGADRSRPRSGGSSRTTPD